TLYLFFHSLFVLHTASHTKIYTLSLHDALPILENDLTVIDTPEGDLQIDLLGSHNMNNLSGAKWVCQHMGIDEDDFYEAIASFRSEEHTSELQSRENLVCRLLLEKKKQHHNKEK